MAHREKFEGKSAKGNFQEALSNAIQGAQRSSTVADDLVSWRLLETDGQAGGIAGLQEITVTIQACFSSR